MFISLLFFFFFPRQFLFYLFAKVSGFVGRWGHVKKNVGLSGGLVRHGN